MDAEIIIAEDGSIDKTYEIAKEHAKRNQRVKVIHAEKRLGKGGGIMHGVRFASGDTILLMDSDLAVAPAQIPKLLETINKGADIAIGSRGLPDSKLLIRPPYYRVFLGKTYSFIFRLLFPMKIYDMQCGFKACRREALIDILRFVNTNGFAFDTDLVVKAYSKGYRITEIPIEWSHIEGSKISAVRQIFPMAMSLFRIWLEFKKEGVKNRRA